MKLHLTVLASSSALVLASTLAAQAQTTPTSSGASEQIIVTARRVEERLQDVPISISVFNQKQLDSHNIVNAADLASYTPSLSANTNFGTNASSFAIRGFQQDIGTQPTVGVYFADVVAARGPSQGTAAGDGAGPGAFFDLQNVQVLKGPQGTLFGRNTTGGAILLVPQKPTDKFEGYVEGSYGNYNMQRIQGAVNVPVNENVRFRVSFDHQTRDGYLKNDSGIGPGTFDDIHYDAVRASLVLDITPNLENYTIASYNHSHTRGDIQKLIACNPSASPLNFLGLLSCGQLATEAGKGAGFYTVESDWPDPESILSQWQVINTTTWHASDTLTVKNIASYAQLKDSEAGSLFGTNWMLAPGLLLPFTATNPIPGGQSTDSSTMTDELQVQGSGLDRRLSYQTGVYYEAALPLALVGNLSPTFASCSSFAPLNCTPFLPPESSANYTAGKTKYHDVGLYGQASYNLTDQLKLTGGFRYTWDRENNTSSRISNAIVAPGVAVPFCTDATQTLPACTEVLQEKSHAPTWLIDLDYRPTDDMLLYAKYARGYRAGGVVNNAPSNYRTFNPEKDDDFELGAKTSFGGALHGTFDIDGFYNNLTNQQLPANFNAAPGAPVSPTTGVVNAGKSRIYGVEIDTSVSPFKDFTVDVGYTYLDATIRSIVPLVSTDPNYVIAGGPVTGDSLGLSPKNKFTVTGTYMLPLDERYGQISVGATFTYTDRQRTSYSYNDPAVLAAFGTDLGILASRKLLDLNLTWNEIAQRPIDLSIFATNVTDAHYYAYVPGLGGNGFETAVLGQPRMVGARLRYHFGS